MGLPKFWTHVLPHVKAAPPVNLHQFAQKTVAVDISPWFYHCSAIKEVVLCSAASPPYEPVALLDEIKRRIAILIDCDIEAILVFDGCRHPMKAVARVEREGKLTAARTFLEKFYERGRRGETISDGDREKAYHMMKQAFVPDERIINLVTSWMKENDIRFFCAPFEAEWQCVEFQKQGVADCIMCVDSDFVVLGATNLCIDTRFNKRSPRCYYYRKDPDLYGGRYGACLRSNEKYLPEAACLIGNDYISKVQGTGPVTALDKILPEYIKALEAGIGNQYLQSFGRSEQYSEQFQKSSNLFRYAPVLRQDATNKDMWNLVPLNLLPANKQDHDDWVAMIGFDPVAILPLRSDQYVKATKFEDCSFINPNGRRLNSFTIHKYTKDDNPSVPENTRLPNFARLDFDAMPLPCIPGDILVLYANAHGIDPGGMDRAALEKEIQKSLEQNQGILHPDEVPQQIDRWIVTEVLDMIDGEDWKDYYSPISSLRQIDRMDIDFFYPLGNEHNRIRAVLLGRGGNLLVRESMAVRVCCDNKKKQKLLVRCDCVPSQKTDVSSENLETGKKQTGYTVFLCFEYDRELRQADWKPLPYPYSCCGCYDGRTFCSHLLALLLLCQLCQRESREGVNKEDFERYLPPAPHVAQSEPVLIENVVRRDKFNRCRGQRKRRKRESEGSTN